MPPVLDLDLLRTFVTVARTGEFKKTAEIVCRSQGAVSMQIKRLEEQTGSRLMERNNRGIQLTEAGETLLIYGEQMLQLSQSAISALSTHELTGKLSVGIPTDYAQDFLSYFMPALHDTLPGLETRIICDRSRNLRQRLTAGELDLAIVAAESDSSTERVVWTEQLIWSAPCAIRLEDQTPLPVALYEDNCIVRDLCLEELKRTGHRYKVVFGSPVMENLATAVEQGFAISLLPESLIRNNRTRMIANTMLSSHQVLKMCLINAEGIDETTVEHLVRCFRQAVKDSQSSY
ncbi:LysR family transcriptional regulator [Oceanospirillum sediminis]|uniref:LysR family transcriptional regulator n=1 Tax=Oceanospirillum sediminis TaxID=2760088 RepID=A0A839INI4_9GAMM|nr:LysR family transcriptional regulator [Oceanospirillum sediminis]MBB1486254.1 LysR family transcriptional regulator [Oceanospirillum sediminis]